MNPLDGERVLLGVTGGIAAYKSVALARRLVAAGAQVRVVMTEAARQFVGELSFQAVTGQPVVYDLYGADANDGMAHIDLTRWATQFMVAPATAHLLARAAHGLADDLLTNLLLAWEGRLVLAPAMNRAMWQHPATRANVELLQQRGVVIAGPASGELACGETGEGRMLEPETLADYIHPARPQSLAGQHVVVTAGPTVEAIDPVRYLSNRSSGRMGYALARAARDAGAKVTLVTGPTRLEAPVEMSVLRAQSARQMHEAVLQALPCDIFIGAAAVADYRLPEPAPDKLKKSSDTLALHLVRNPDIIHQVAQSGQAGLVVGFAAETRAVEAHARDKLARKGLDMIVANPVDGSKTGFDVDYNQGAIITADTVVTLPPQPKWQMAARIIETIAQHREETGGAVEDPAEDT